MMMLTTSLVEYFYMLELVVLGLISLALIFLTASIIINRINSRDVGSSVSRGLQYELERDSQQVSETLQSLKQLESQVKVLADQYEDKYHHLNKSFEVLTQKAELFDDQTNQIMKDKFKLGEKIESMERQLEEGQKQWDEQWTGASESMQRIHETLESSLLRVDNALRRINEQEIIAQSFNQKISDAYDELVNKKQDHIQSVDHSRSQVVEVLDDTVEESKKLLQQLKSFQAKTEQAFHNYNDVLGGYEDQAYEQFDSLFNQTDSARQELTASLEESRQYMDELKASARTVDSPPLLEIDFTNNISSSPPDTKK